MAAKTERVTGLGERDKEQLSVTPGLTDLPSFQKEQDLDRIATDMSLIRQEMERTIAALREKFTKEHITQVAAGTVREVIAQPRSRKKGIVAAAVISGVGLLLLSIKIVSYRRTRRRRRRA
jgi:hypothetical protein